MSRFMVINILTMGNINAKFKMQNAKLRRKRASVLEPFSAFDYIFSQL